MTHTDVLIVGGGQAGAQTAVALRQRHFNGTIAIVGTEPHLPYERPALSKQYLAGTKAWERMLLRPATFWAERQIALLLGRTVARIDPEAHVATTSDGGEIGYGTLVWAAGGAPRRLTCPGGTLGGVHVIRGRDDVDLLAREAASARNIVVIGGGYVGLEAAATLAAPARSITVVEAQERLLARTSGPDISAFYAAEHRAHGVAIRLGAAVERLEGVDGRVAGVVLHDGTTLPADLVIVGIGIVPAVEPLLAAGAGGGANGVAVDAWCRTGLPDIYAVGDCALHPNRAAGGTSIRLESIQNANDMADTVARAITGDPGPYEATPWFWSNQYDLRLQTVGLSGAADRTVRRGAEGARAFSVLYLKGDVLVAVDAVNATADFVQARALVATGAAIDARLAADPAVPLKDPRILKGIPARADAA